MGSNMKKLFLMGVAFSALFAAPAMAADMAVRPAPVYKAPPPVVVAYYNWTGCYIGGEIGGLWARKQWTDDVLGQSFGSHNASGFLGGLQAGCDLQFGGGFVIGVQADYDWTNAKGSNVNAFDARFTDETRVHSVGSATARFGYGWDRFLGYVKVGAAYEHANYDFAFGGVSVTSGEEKRRLGWTIGVGGEYAFTNWLSGFVEYDYYNFGTRGPEFFDPIFLSRVDIRETNNVVKAGLNFRFGNWGGGVARY
jgi:outer membrane immunogenic protein